MPANPLSTPAHLVPEWYFWPFYSILRAFTFYFLFVPAKLLGVMAMFASLLLLFFLPWLDRSPVRSGNYRPLFEQFFWVLVVAVVILGSRSEERRLGEVCVCPCSARGWPDSLKKQHTKNDIGNPT